MSTGQLEPTLDAFIAVTAEATLEQVKRAEAELFSGRDRGPLHGVPVALEDLIDTSGVRTTCGRVRAQHPPAADAGAGDGHRAG